MPPRLLSSGDHVWKDVKNESVYYVTGPPWPWAPYLNRHTKRGLISFQDEIAAARLSFSYELPSRIPTHNCLFWISHKNVSFLLYLLLPVQAWFLSPPVHSLFLHLLHHVLSLKGRKPATMFPRCTHRYIVCTSVSVLCDSLQQWHFFFFFFWWSSLIHYVSFSSVYRLHATLDRHSLLCPAGSDHVS